MITPKINWSLVITAVIAATPPTIMALAAFNKAADTHQLVNSRMTELLELTKKASKSEGKSEEQSDELARKGAVLLKESTK